MSDAKLDIDLRQALQEVGQLRSGYEALRNEMKNVEQAQKSVFDTTEAKVFVNTIDVVQEEYNKLARAAKTLRDAAKSAQDPDAWITYARAQGQAEAGMKRLSDEAKRVGVNLEKGNKQASLGKEVFSEFFGTFTKAALIATAVIQVVNFTKSAVALSVQLDRAEKSFASFAGGADKAKGIVADLVAFSNKEVLNTDSVLQAGKSLLSVGQAADTLTIKLGRINDISAGSGKNFNELATIYAKARSAGVLYAEDINQLIDAGIPIIQQFAKQFGVSESAVKKLASEGKVSFEELDLAFAELTKTGAAFYGQSEVAANSLPGLWQQTLNRMQPLMKGFGDFVSSIGKQLLKRVNEDLDMLSGFGDRAKSVFETIKGYIGLASAQVVTPSADTQDRAALERDRADYERDLNERVKLQEAAEKKRRDLNKATAEQAKKIREQQTKDEEERTKLRISLIADDYEREVAIENARYTALLNDLNKYFKGRKELNGLIAQAEAQHKDNLKQIDVERLLNEAEKLAKLEELRAAEGDFEKDRQKKQLDQARATIEIDKQITDERIKLSEQNVEAFLKQLEASGASTQEISQRRAEFDALLQTQRLQAEIDFQQKLLGLVDAGDTKQIELIKARIEALNAELSNVGADTTNTSNKTIWDLLGIDKKDQAGFQEAADQVINAIQSVSAARIEAAQIAVDTAEKQVSAAEDALDRELQLAELGFASDVSLRQKQLEEAKKAQEQALKERQRAQRQQILLDSALQASSLITSSTNIYKALSSLGPIGIVLAIGTIATMFSAFASAKAKALAATKVQQFRHGGGGRIDKNGFVIGPSHEEGGVGIEVEGGEMFGTDGRRFEVVNKRMTSKHLDLLRAINADDQAGMAAILRKLQSNPTVNRKAVADNLGIDLDGSPGSAPARSGTNRNGGDGFTKHERSELIGLLRAWKSSDENKETRTQEGSRTVIRRGNYTRVVKNG